MVYTYTPTNYSSLHDSITSLCKNILPFSLKKRRLPAIAVAEQQFSKQQSDNLKWQQESFHQILKLMGLCKEGILPETEVSAFQSHLLDTLVASPLDHEHPMIIRDKLIFLQELFFAKCISEEEYHSSKRPLLQRLAVQGAEIESREVVVGAPKGKSDEEWSVIDLKDEQGFPSKESLNQKNRSKHGSAIKQIKGAGSVLGFVSSQKNGKFKEDTSITQLGKENFGTVDTKITSLASGKNELGLSQENPFWNYHLTEKDSQTRSILMSERLAKVEKQSGGDKVKKKPFRTLFQREQSKGHGSGVDAADNCSVSEERNSRSGKKPWGFDGFKKWKKSDSEDETAPLSLNGRSDGETYLGHLLPSPDTKQIKRILHSDGSTSDFFVDKLQVLGNKIKKELLRIKMDLSTGNPNAQFSNEQIEVISSRLPVDKADLKRFFPKSWCDQYGDLVLEVVRKEFKEHVEEMKSLPRAAKEKDGSKQWATFEDDDDENCRPNLFAPPPQVISFPMNQTKISAVKHNSNTECFKNNPFFDE